MGCVVVEWTLEPSIYEIGHWSIFAKIDAGADCAKSSLIFSTNLLHGRGLYC